MTTNSINQNVSLDVLTSKIGYHLRIAEREINKSRNFSRGTGFTIVQYSVFAVIATNEGVSQVAIGQALNMDKPSVMTVVNRFVESGLIARKVSKKDMRSYALHLTPQGKKEYVSLEKQVINYDDQFKKRLKHKEIKELIGMLSRLVRDK